MLACPKSNDSRMSLIKSLFLFLVATFVPTNAKAQFNDPTGNWLVQIAGEQGELIIESQASTFDGRLVFETRGSIEVVQGNLTGNGLSFVRVIPGRGNQNWIAQFDFRGNLIGNWSGVGGSGSWSARRADSGLSLLPSGFWNVQANSTIGQLNIIPGTLDFNGTIYFPIQNTRESIMGVLLSSGKVMFRRALASGGSQLWIGRFNDFGDLDGTWTGKGGSGSWSAQKSSTEGTVEMSGSWDIQLSTAVIGQLDLFSNGAGFEGTLVLPAYRQNDRIIGVSNEGGLIVFTRVLATGGTQVWSAFVDFNGNLQGSWAGKGGSGTWTGNQRF